MESTATLKGAVQFDVPSRASGLTYRVYVAMPIMPPPPGGYPVVYLTDGDGLFGTFQSQALLRQLGGEVVPAIIVGIGYPDSSPLAALRLRNKDLTPPTPDDKVIPMLKAPPFGGQVGGADAFRRFLVDELRPVIAKRASTDPARQILYGDSLGGLFALGVMFQHPADFSTYLISSPSVWWNDRAVLKDEPNFRRGVEAGDVTPRILITVGGLEQQLPARLPPGLAADAIRKLIGDFRMVDNATELASRLKAYRGRGNYEVEMLVFPGETHASVVPASISRSLEFALRP